jgi:hypothetical protein
VSIAARLPTAAGPLRPAFAKAPAGKPVAFRPESQAPAAPDVLVDRLRLSASASQAPDTLGAPVALVAPDVLVDRLRLSASASLAPDAPDAPDGLVPVAPEAVTDVADVIVLSPFVLAAPPAEDGDSFFTGALKKTGGSLARTGESIVKTGVKTGTVIGGALRGVGGAILRVF